MSWSEIFKMRGRNARAKLKKMEEEEENEIKRLERQGV